MAAFNLRSLLYYVLGREISDPGEVRIDKYETDTYALAKSIMIYDEKELRLSQSSIGTEPAELTDWRYIKHLRGEPDSNDPPGIDTDIQLAYENSTLEEVLSKYAGYEVLVYGALFPYIVKEEAPPKHGTILHYDKSLVESTEKNLIKELERAIQLHGDRWDVDAYGLIDAGYTFMSRIILGLDLIPIISEIRDRHRYTNYAHSFYIKQHLASNGGIDRAYRFFSTEQALWFYRNLRSIIKNQGTEQQNQELVRKLFTESGFSISDVDYRRKGQLDGNLDISYEHQLKDRKTKLVLPKEHRDLRKDSLPLAEYNKDISVASTDRLGRFTRQDNQQGKFLYVSLSGVEATTLDPLAYKLKYWGYLVHKGYNPPSEPFSYKTATASGGVKDSKITLSFKEALTAIYILNCQLGKGNYDNGVPNSVTIRRVRTKSIPSGTITTHTTPRDTLSINEALVPFPSTLNPGAVVSYTDKIIARDDALNTRFNGIGSMYRKIEFRKLMDLVHEDISVSLPFSSLLNSGALSSMADDPSRILLINALLSKFMKYSGKEDVEKTLKAKAFIEVYRTLSSYDTDILLVANTATTIRTGRVLPRVLNNASTLVSEHRVCMILSFPQKRSITTKHSVVVGAKIRPTKITRKISIVVNHGLLATTRRTDRTKGCSSNLTFTTTQR